MRAYTLPSGNVRGKGPASARRRVISSPCTPDEGRSCPPTLTNPARIGCAIRRALLPRYLQRQGFRAPTPTRSVAPLHHEPGRNFCIPAGAFAPMLRPTRHSATVRRIPRQRAFLPLDPDLPSAGWTRAMAMLPWTSTRRALLPRAPQRQGFRAPTPTTGIAPPDNAERPGVRSRP